MELEVPFSPALVKSLLAGRGRLHPGADYALSNGIAISIGGGFHHAFPDHGEGFCMIHDVAIAIRRMERDGKIRTAMTVDCDVHQGNGPPRFSPVRGRPVSRCRRTRRDSESRELS